MKKLITIKNDKVFGCVIDTDQEDYIALWRFLWRFYPCNLSSEEYEEGEWEQVLICKAFHTKIIMNGDLTAYSKIGEFGISDDIKQDFIPFEGKDLEQWVANKYEAINEERRNCWLNIEMAKEFANPTKIYSFEPVRYYKGDSSWT